MTRYPIAPIGVALLLAACNKPGTYSTGGSGTAATAANQAATAPALNVPYKPGQTLVILKDRAKCRETRPDAGEPWEIKIGSTVDFVAVEGSKLRVNSGVECLIDPDAVGPAH